MREALASVTIHSRKRKKSSPSLTSVFTRSKSRIFLHHNRSGLSRPDPVARKHNPQMQSLEAFLGVNCRTASRVFSTKDLRHKRVFSPDVNSLPAEETDDDENEERKKLFKGFDASSAPPSRIDGANGLNLKDQPIPKFKMPVHRRKVFKTPSSFSYRRLLPHLMDIVNDNTSSVSEIEIVDAGSPCKFPKLNGVNFKMRSIAENSYEAKTQFNDSKPSQNRNLDKVHTKVFSIQPDLSAADNELGSTAETNRPLDVEENGQENDDVNGVDASVEEHLQTTPPDPALFAKIEELAKNQTFVGLPGGSEKSSSGAMKQSPNTNCSDNSMNKAVLNPCSRQKLFKNPRSLSYRRLLPFLLDISKTSSGSSRKPQQKMPQVALEEDRHPAPAASAELDNVNNTTKQNSEKKKSEDLIQNNPFSVVPLPASNGSSLDSNNNLVSSISDSSNVVTLTDLGMLTEEIPQSQNNPTKLQLDLGSKESSSSVSEPSSTVNNDIRTEQCTSEEPRSFKGILKRNRRGCRGLCNCLNCASFRLHAERAFEFSRNQLHDAEEVASELMKELANLRLLLQKSITENDDSASVRPHPVLIKQACNKALDAETLAKERLNELNNDLSVHCKVPDLLQPKVTFAYNI